MHVVRVAELPSSNTLVVEVETTEVDAADMGPEGLSSFELIRGKILLLKWCHERNLLLKCLM